MNSGITKIYDRKTVGHVFTKPVQIEGTTQNFFSPRKLFFIVVNIRSWYKQFTELLQQWRIAMHPCWLVCGKNLNIVSMYGVLPVVHKSNMSSYQKKLFQFCCGCEQFNWGMSFGVLVVNVCNHGEHYETPCRLYNLVYITVVCGLHVEVQFSLWSL
jgi:hypothetical protein